MGVVETRVGATNIPKVQDSFLPKNWICHTNIQHCSSVRIWFCWDQSLHVDVIEDSYQFIHCKIDLPTGNVFCLCLLWK